MKKHYSAPTLTTHGSIETITQMFGNNQTRKDFLFFNGNSIQADQLPSQFTDGHVRGSIDGCVGPVTTKKCL